MKRPSETLALCSAVPFAGGEGVPEWVHLLPAGVIRTVDGRGPYSVASMQAVSEASLAAGQKLPIDENHATDKGAALGLPAPARGWIVALEARDDGLWGRVEWTAEGQKMVEDRAYGGISPVVLHSADNKIMRVLRASLTNVPNLQGLVTLHSENYPMDWKAKLIELLGLDASADDAAIEAALLGRLNDEPDPAASTATQSQRLIDHPSVIALQSQLNDALGQINALSEGAKRKSATDFVDGAIRDGRAGLKPMRDEYIAIHMENPDRAEKLIAAMPRIAGSTIAAGAVTGGSADSATLSADERQIMALFGVSEEEFLAARKRDGLAKEAF